MWEFSHCRHGSADPSGARDGGVAADVRYGFQSSDPDVRRPYQKPHLISHISGHARLPSALANPTGPGRQWLMSDIPRPKEKMRERGLEPLYLAVPDPKSGASASFATLARAGTYAPRAIRGSAAHQMKRGPRRTDESPIPFSGQPPGCPATSPAP